MIGGVWLLIVVLCYFHGGKITAKVSLFLESWKEREITMENEKKWLTLPVEKDGLRYETLLKLFFGNEKGEKQALIHIEAFGKRIKNELPFLLRAKTALSNSLEDDSTHKYYLLTVEFGIKTYQTYLAWCREAKKILMTHI